MGIKKVLTGPIDWFMYNVLSENQRKRLGDLFTDEQKEKLRAIILGKQQLQRQELKQIRYHLYNLGFQDRGLSELKSFYEQNKYPYIKRLTAWELALWYANDYSKEGAEKALQYIAVAKDGEKNQDQLRRFGIVEAECYDLLQKKEMGKVVLQDLIHIQPHPDLFLGMANLENSIDKKLDWINKVMEQYHLTPIYFEKGNDSTYDDLRTQSSNESIEDVPKISVILPAFKAEQGIRIAIESILSQTWKNLELIVVDDCSPDGTAEVVKEYVAKDPRVKLLSTPENSGPYVARNIGLQHVTGDFITVNDSDDWSHAQKLEIQARHLMQHQDIIANTSAHARLTEDIKFYRRGTPGKYIFPNMSSLMFRRKPVLEKLGNWDSVRFAADGEFKRRLIKAFGKNKFVDLNSGPLSLPRQSVNSLTGSSAFGYNGFFMGARKEYVESFSTYHQSGRSLFYPYPADKRLYPVPEPMWPKREEKQENYRYFEMILVADYRDIPNEAVDKIKSLSKTSSRIGLIQMNKYDVKLSNKKIRSEIRALIDNNQVHMLVFGEQIKARHLVVLGTSILHDFQRYIPSVTTDQIKVMVDHFIETDITKYKKNLDRYFSGPMHWLVKDNDLFEKFKVAYPNEVDFLLLDKDWKI
ncbi:glycosyltransferase [Ornithinibacillus sp. BX22]|uniref:Glycosyltransferase n=1 Tax=Ornithinibacillus hominis TaxID=2763055 RepID=A0A923RGN0_9BACI|nr:glycosyltransferase [Ornithinibacillus hominis]MBC5635693.1 glycosyltransferase [Ornithinibacillus hominis]